tara:strand:+ start:1556 stop:2440 length:885 start_codon:yes stop_codon:yes gene_type:complete
MPSKFIFKKPLVLKQGTGVSIDPNNTELFARVEPSQTTTISIGQSVSSGSNVTFNTITANRVIIDSGSLILSGSDHTIQFQSSSFSTAIISGSFTLGGTLNVGNNLTTNKNLTIQGRLTAKHIHSQVSESFTLFESGSTRFGDTSDDTHQFSGSVIMSGSILFDNTNIIREFSNDTTLSDSNTTTLPTENALKTYIDDQTDSQQAYLRKSFTHTGSFISVSTSSFTAVTASAPSDLTATSETDFIFFINGQMMEHDALTIRQTGSLVHLQIDNESIGFDMEVTDEVVGFGKFNS